VVVYVTLIPTFWLLIWGVIEPIGTPDSLPGIIATRWVLHAGLSILLAAHATLVLDLLQRRHLWKKLPRIMDARALKAWTYDQVYDVRTASAFYDQIAESYDQRNSQSLLRVYEEVIKVVERVRVSAPSIEVIDLGGGTGKGVAHHFFQQAGMRWEYVDASAHMARQFNSNLQGTNLKTSCNVSDLHAFLGTAQKGKYDVVLLSLVLTSLEHNPEWAKVAACLKPGGRLIVADIDATYTAQNPYYIIEVQGRTHALAPRAVSLTQVYNEAKQAGLKLEHTQPVVEGTVNYAYIAEFSAP